MNEQQQRMAAVGTDKELSDLLDFSAVREWESSRGGSGWHGGDEPQTVWVWSRCEQKRSGKLNVRSLQKKKKSWEENLPQNLFNRLFHFKNMCMLFSVLDTKDYKWVGESIMSHHFREMGIRRCLVVLFFLSLTFAPSHLLLNSFKVLSLTSNFISSANFRC